MTEIRDNSYIRDYKSYGEVILSDLFVSEVFDLTCFFVCFFFSILCMKLNINECSSF